jgi:hypothetical protein
MPDSRPSQEGDSTPTERIEIIDGREFRVTVLPEVKPRKTSPTKVGGGKRYSKQSALATTHAHMRVCPKCKRHRPADAFTKKRKDAGNGKWCLACRRSAGPLELQPATPQPPKRRRKKSR